MKPSSRQLEYSEESTHIAPDKTHFSPKNTDFSYFSTKTYVVKFIRKCLKEVLLMSTHNICFHGETRNVFKGH